jgi:hypothetical protein
MTLPSATTTGGGWCSLHGGFGGFYCPGCTTGIGPLASTYLSIPPRLAWTCPVCGNGCAPHADVCSHAKVLAVAGEPDGGATP